MNDKHQIDNNSSLDFDIKSLIKQFKITNTQTINVATFNIRGGFHHDSKRNDILQLLAEYNIHICFLCETNSKLKSMDNNSKHHYTEQIKINAQNLTFTILHNPDPIQIRN